MKPHLFSVEQRVPIVNRFTVIRSLVAGAGISLLTSCGESTSEPNSAPLFNTTVVFGASLDDTGNACNLSASNCPPPPYATGRASNGPLYVELIAARYGASITPSRTGGTNYAYGGARTGAIAGTNQGVPNMVQQADAYLAASGTGSRARALFVVNAATVGNDITDALVLSRTNPQAPSIIIGGAVTNISSLITRLYNGGARHLLLLNSTDVGRTPLVRSAGPAASAAATAMSAQFNIALGAQVTTLRSSLPGVNLYVLDLGQLTVEVFANPATFGFTNITAACVSGASVCATPDTYFFWDAFHPTATTGRLVSQRGITALGR